MPINFIRIDDRLIHGQIVVAWSKSFSTNRILVVDDLVYNDEFLTNVLRMVAPSDIELVISNIENCKQLINKYELDSKNTMILIKTPMAAKAIFDANIKIKSLNVGGMGAKPGRTQLYKNISASDLEVKTLKEINANGIEVYFQITPTTAKVSFNQVI